MPKLTMPAAALAMVTSAAALALAPAASSAQPYGYGMMGGYGMGPGMMFGAANQPAYPGWGGGIADHDQAAAYIQAGNQTGTVDPETNTITYSGTEITINMVAVQPDHEDQTFEVHSLTNPTLVVPAGAVIHLNLLNMDYGDNMEHGLILTPAPPPYPVMAMMASGPGLARVMPLLPWRSNKNVVNARYAVLGTTFVARDPGTYWYLCPTPQHAEQGMFGKFVVRRQ